VDFIFLLRAGYGILFPQPVVRHRMTGREWYDKDGTDAGGRTGPVG
jgi:hypothetical protein